MNVAQLIAELKTMDQSVEVLIDMGDGLADVTSIERGMVKIDDTVDDDWAYVLSTPESDAREDADNRATLEAMGHTFTED